MIDVPSLESLAGNPEDLERAYQRAQRAGDRSSFASAVAVLREREPENKLWAAWHYRLAYSPDSVRRAIDWTAAVPAAIACGLALWLISDDSRYSIRITNPFSGVSTELLPAVILVAAPVAAASIILWLTVAGRRSGRTAAATIAVLAMATIYVGLAYPQAGPRVFQEQYIGLMIGHLALLSWAAIGYVALSRPLRAPGEAPPDAQSATSDISSSGSGRFALLAKSLEFTVVAGLFAALGGVFIGVTIGLFDALGIQLAQPVLRLLLAGGAGVVAVLAAAMAVEPDKTAENQSFDEGPSRLVAMLLRLLLVPALVVLAVFVGLIPFRFSEPFENRDVLIAFNAMLFAVVALIVGAVPVDGGEMTARARVWLRRGIILLSALALIIGVYALAAIVYRTYLDRLTPNRLAFIGWGFLNVGVLAWLLLNQLVRRSRRAFDVAGSWFSGIQESLAGASTAYVVWAAAVLFAVPWLFGIDREGLDSLPVALQEIAIGSPQPILLKCLDSPHIYLLEGGERRWIQDIPTLNARGYRWEDVHFVACDLIDLVPLGEPIPSDAGTPPPPPLPSS